MEDVQIMADPRTGSRVASVRLRLPVNVRAAVAKVNNSQVVDGHEQRTLYCSAAGTGGGQQNARERRVLYVDELPMTMRPQTAAHPGDREVFLTNLPVEHYSRDQIWEWFKDFGAIEDLNLLGASGNCYVRYAQHDAAAAWIGTQEAGVTANWSESERLLRGVNGAYGVEAASVFDQVRGFCQVVHGQPNEQQLHFIQDCTEAEFTSLRESLASTLSSFHGAYASHVAQNPMLSPPAPPQAAAASYAHMAPGVGQAQQQRPATYI